MNYLTFWLCTFLPSMSIYIIKGVWYIGGSRASSSPSNHFASHFFCLPILHQLYYELVYKRIPKEQLVATAESFPLLNNKPLSPLLLYTVVFKILLVCLTLRPQVTRQVFIMYHGVPQVSGRKHDILRTIALGQRDVPERLAQ